MTSADKFGIGISIAICIAAVVFVSAPGDVSDVVEQTSSYVSPPSTTTSSSSMTMPKTEPVQHSMSDDNLTNVLKYNIRGGIVNSITGDSDENSVVVDITSQLPGQLSITMDASVVTPFSDRSYFVLVDGEENHDFNQSGFRLTISFDAGTEQITIFGDNDERASLAAEKAAADKAAADKAAAEREAAAAEREALMAEREAEARAADKAAADKAAAEKAAAEKAAAEKAAAEKAAAEKAAAIPKTATVENAQGSSVPGCEPDCFLPNTVTIAKGGTVSFVNSDTAPHTSTSGTAADGPDGVWDSSLVMAGASYDVTLNSSGTYNYFCMVHPWMQGTVIVK